MFQRTQGKLSKNFETNQKDWYTNPDFHSAALTLRVNFLAYLAHRGEI